MTARTISPLFTWRTAIARSDLDSTTRLVAFSLSLFMSELGDSAYPSVAKVAEAAGLGESTTRSHLRKLEQRGWLSRDPGGGRTKSGRGITNRYYARVPENPPAPGGLGEPEPASSDPSTPREMTPNPPAPGPNHVSTTSSTTPEPSADKPRKRRPDIVFDAIAEGFGLPYGGGRQSALCGESARFVRDEMPDATDEERATEAARRIANIPKDWGPVTPKVLPRWWHRLDRPMGRPQAQRSRSNAAELIRQAEEEERRNGQPGREAVPGLPGGSVRQEL